MSKPQTSKLTPHAETLVSMELEGKTLPEMITWLRGEGVTVAASTLSVFLSGLREQRRDKATLDSIISGSRQSKDVEKAFAANPAPELGTLIKLVQVLIMKLSLGGVDNPEMLTLADRMTNTVVAFLSGQTKAAHKEREVALAELKHAEAKKDEWSKALEYCLEEAKKFPDVLELFKVAFAALKKAKGGK